MDLNFWYRYASAILVMGNQWTSDGMSAGPLCAVINATKQGNLNNCAYSAIHFEVKRPVTQIKLRKQEFRKFYT